MNRLEQVRVLKGIPQPTAICPVDNHAAAVLCRREIKVIDLNKGELRVNSLNDVIFNHNFNDSLN